MQLNFDISIANRYKSKSQQIRIMSENWVEKNIYCVKCGGVLHTFKNNNPVGDFYCTECFEEFELKSKDGKPSQKITDGAYATMMEKIKKNQIPNLFYLTYNADMVVDNLMIIPKYYFTEKIIEKRTPLSLNSRRQGWIGCNINLRPVPESGKLFLIKNKIIKDKKEVLDRFNKMLFLARQPIQSRGWLLDIISCIERLKMTDFSLSDLYRFEKELSIQHPHNENIKAKIRQQLQILRDNQYIRFVHRGKYQLYNK